MEELKLLGKVIIKGKIKTETGLTIGGSTVGLEIGGVDNPVIKDAEGRPYIPGSSLKGKMRSLLAKAEGKKLEEVSKKPLIRIHKCTGDTICSLCQIFGLPSDAKNPEPTRLIVRDAFLTEESQKKLKEMPTDLEFTEVKFENVIDRITSAANPRQMERVPAGVEFEFELIYNVFNEQDKENLREVFKAKELLENDYLGSSGSRGYGKIKFDDIDVYWNSKDDYEKGEVEEKKSINGENKTVAKIMQNFTQIKGSIN